MTFRDKAVQELWDSAREFAERNLIRMNGGATEEEINEVAKNVFKSVAFLVSKEARRAIEKEARRA